MKNTKFRLLTLGFTSLLLLGSANAATIAQFDLGESNALGWTLLTKTSLSGTSNGVTLTVASPAAIDSRNRGSGGDIAEDFFFNGTTITFTFTNLAVSQEYEFLTYAYDANGMNNAASWYVGSVAAENLQFAHNSSSNFTTPFSLTGTSDASGELQIFVVATAGNNRANGFEVVLIPEPSTALLGGLGLLALLRRRR